jgi:tetratricopeptide (TPR) repeat protein
MSHVRALVWCLLFAAFALAAAWGFAPLALAATGGVKVKMDGALMGNVARIGFEWERPLRFRSSVSGNELTIEFDEPVNASTIGVLSSLRDYVLGAQTSPDGTKVTFALTQPVAAKPYASGAANGVELYIEKKLAERHTSQAVPVEKVAVTDNMPAPEQPPAPATEATEEKAPSVKLTATLTPSGNDAVLSFDWSEKASYRLFQKGNQVVVEFNRNAPHQTAAIPSSLKGIIKRVKKRDADGHLIYTLDTAEPLDIRHERKGKKVVVTLAKPAATTAVATAEPPPAAPTAIAAAPSKPAEAPVPAAPAPEPAPAVPLPGKPTTALYMTDGGQKASASTTRVQSGLLPDGQRYRPRNPSPAQSPGQPLVPEVKGNGKDDVISFPWTENTAMAQFVKDGVGWIVFNKPSVLDVKPLKGSKLAHARGFDVVPHPSATVIQFQPVGEMTPMVSREGNRWTLTLKDGKSGGTQPLAIQAKTDANGVGELTIPLRDYGAPLGFDDTYTGTRLAVVPIGNAGYGVTEGQNYVDARFAPSSQGIAVDILREDIQLDPRENLLAITGPYGLTLSPDLPAPPPTISDDFLETGKLFPQERWRTPEGKRFNEALVGHLGNLMRARQTNPSPFRLRLAQFYLAESMFPEALGLLDRIAADDPDFAKARRLQALRGIALFGRGQNEEARQAFSAPELEGLKEVAMWLDLLSVANGTYEAPLRPDASWEQYLYGYDPRTNQKLAFALADKYMRDKNYSKALDAIDRLSKNNSLAGAEYQAQFATGMVAAAGRKFNEAITLWQPLTLQTENPRIRAMATLAMTDLQYNLGLIKREDAIKKLEAIRLVWRDDEIEQQLLRVLGQLYIDDGRVREGLHVWKELVSNFPNSPLSQAIAGRMGDIFIQQFNRGGADGLPPLEALSLYYEFRELTPLGDEGDTMIQNLADRLVQIDLLDRASALLTHQIRYRLQGDELARVGTRLAFVQLLNNQPEMAIETIQATQQEKMKDEIVIARRHLLAEALLKTGKLDDAFQLVEADNTPEGQELAVSILWKRQDWPRTVNYLKDILARPTSRKKGEPVDDARAQHILRLAIAQQFMNDRPGIANTRASYLSELAGSDYAESFDFLTEKAIDINHTNLAKMEGIISRLDGFMKRFREKMNLGPRATEPAAPKAADAGKPVALPPDAKADEPAAKAPTTTEAQPGAPAQAEPTKEELDGPRDEPYPTN